MNKKETAIVALKKRENIHNKYQKNFLRNNKYQFLMLHGLSYFLHFVIFYLIIPSSWETEDAIFFPYVFVV